MAGLDAISPDGSWAYVSDRANGWVRVVPTPERAKVAVTAVAFKRTVYLARHGETEWNRIGRWQGATDIPLSDVGRAQARLLADRLRDRRIARVHASQLSRALETAQIIAARLGAPAPTADTEVARAWLRRVRRAHP